MTRVRSSAFRVPILWLFLGLPIFRSISARGALASVDGNVGYWNLLRIGWWLVVGAIAVAGIWRHRAVVKDLFADGLGFVGWSGLWLLALFVSTAVSPSPTFTLAVASMMTILVITAFDLALRVRARKVDPREVLRALFVFAWILLLTILAAYFLEPRQVSVDTSTFGLRIVGGYVGDTSLLAVVVVLLAIELGARASSAFRRSFYAVAGLAGLVLLLLAQTRTSYITFLVGAVLMFLQYVGRERLRKRLAAVGVAFVVVGLLLSVAVVPEILGHSGPVERAFVYLRRDNQSWETASGRFGIWTVLLQKTYDRPLGLGYSAGPRVVLQDSRWPLWKYGVIAKRIGNAHNAYVEIFAGTGYLGLFAWLAFLVWVVVRAFVVRGRDLGVVRALLAVMLLNGLTGSEGVLPFMQASALIWIVAGFLLGYARHRAGRGAVRAAVD